MPDEQQNTNQENEPYPQLPRRDELEPSVQSFSAPIVPPVIVPVEPIQQANIAPQWGETVSPIPPIADRPVAVASPKKSKKRLIIGVLIAAFLVVFVGGGVFAYNVWYQNPEKVITDAILNAATAKSSIYTGNVTTDGKDQKISVDLTAKQAGVVGSFDAKVTTTIDKKDYTFNSSVLVDASNDLYIKFDKVSGIVTELKSQLGTFALDPALSSTIDKFVSKIDSTWIKVSSADLKDFSGTFANSKTCLQDTMKKLKDDKPAISELTNMYEKNSFIVVDKKIGSKDGSLGYKVKGDPKAAKDFAEGLKTTQVYKTLKECDKTFDIDSSDFSKNFDTGDGTIELWVSRWSHQITKWTFSSKSDGETTTGVITPTYNQPVKIVTPSSSTSLTQLKTDIEVLLQSIMLNALPVYSSASTDAASIQMYAELYAADHNGSYPTLDQLKSTLPIDIQARMSAVVAGGSDPDVLGYVGCGINKGADISYYNVATGSVKHVTAGRCS
ncbi:hypothetical protein H7X68_00495 [Candidatus Saccharibacteria bacterium]|nr:hypothetical protein [Candidatus Saccharibacteria bacterium]